MKWWRMCISLGLATTPAWAEVKKSDLDGDGVVSLSDLAILLSDFALSEPQRWTADSDTAALWYLNGNGRDFSENGNHLNVKGDQVGWNADAPHGSCAMLGEDGYIADCFQSEGGALTAPGDGCTYPGHGDFTVEAIINYPLPNESYDVIYHYSEHVAGHEPYGLFVRSGVAQFEINNTVVVSADVSAYRKQWIELSAVYREGLDAALFVNGQLLAAAATTLVPEFLPNYDVYLGGNYCGTSLGLRIDEARISTADRQYEPFAWAMRSPEHSPTGRYGIDMKYFAATGETLVFGGWSGDFMNDLWGWDGSDWHDHTPAAGPNPPVRYSHAMAYDADRQVLVLFGGNNGNINLGDTWEWNGSAWTEVAVGQPHPIARSGHAMAYDKVRHEIVLFGGAFNDGSWHRLNDTWVLANGQWTQRTQDGALGQPSRRGEHGMIFDETRREVMMFGGADGSGLMNDTWVWNGAAWTQKTGLAQRPAPRSSFAMDYDPQRRVTILYGGSANPGTYGDTWEWNGAQWHPTATTGPSPRGPRGTFDRSLSKFVIFGGYETIDETWEYSAN